MKLTIVFVVISLLSLAECDPCGQSEFSTTYECKKCFCSGVSSECLGSSFFQGKIIGDLDDIEGILKILNNGTVNKVIHDYGGTVNIPEGLEDFSLRWILPANFYNNGLRTYGGTISMIQTIKAPPSGLIDEIISVTLRSDKRELWKFVQPFFYSDYRLEYNFNLIEGSWSAITRDYVPATRDDMMIVLANLREIEVYAPRVSNLKAIFIEKLTMDLAVDDVENPADATQTDLIEICHCPEGYSGESCDKCSCGYYRNSTDVSESVFGACSRCPCDRDDKGCIIDKCTVGIEIFSNCD